MTRLYSLDYLRGIAAFGIMIYHYLTWTGGRFTAEAFRGRVGIYGVSIFYVLSGLTLFHVYYPKMSPSLGEVRRFAKKRVFRILLLGHFTYKYFEKYFMKLGRSGEGLPVKPAAT